MWILLYIFNCSPVPWTSDRMVPDSVLLTRRLTWYPPGPVPGMPSAQVWDLVFVTTERVRRMWVMLPGVIVVSGGDKPAASKNFLVLIAFFISPPLFSRAFLSCARVSQFVLVKESRVSFTGFIGGLLGDWLQLFTLVFPCLRVAEESCGILYIFYSHILVTLSVISNMWPGGGRVQEVSAHLSCIHTMEWIPQNAFKITQDCSYIPSDAHMWMEEDNFSQGRSPPHWWSMLCHPETPVQNHWEPVIFSLHQFPQIGSNLGHLHATVSGTLIPPVERDMVAEIEQGSTLHTPVHSLQVYTVLITNALFRPMMMRLKFSFNRSRTSIELGSAKYTLTSAALYTLEQVFIGTWMMNVCFAWQTAWWAGSIGCL